MAVAVFFSLPDFPELPKFKQNKVILRLTKNLGDVGVVHVWARFENLSPLVLCPDHERVHRPLDVLAALSLLSRLRRFTKMSMAKKSIIFAAFVRT